MTVICVRLEEQILRNSGLRVMAQLVRAEIEDVFTEDGATCTKVMNAEPIPLDNGAIAVLEEIETEAIKGKRQSKGYILFEWNGEEERDVVEIVSVEFAL